jgi:hypothetical protein
MKPIRNHQPGPDADVRSAGEAAAPCDAQSENRPRRRRGSRIPSPSAGCALAPLVPGQVVADPCPIAASPRANGRSAGIVPGSDCRTIEPDARLEPLPAARRTAPEWAAGEPARFSMILCTAPTPARSFCSLAPYPTDHEGGMMRTTHETLVLDQVFHTPDLVVLNAGHPEPTAESANLSNNQHACFHWQ